MESSGIVMWYLQMVIIYQTPTINDVCMRCHAEKIIYSMGVLAFFYFLRNPIIYLAGNNPVNKS